jgi:hypothetical protein
MNSIGLPHSEISGSKPVSSSPKLIAAFHVLHRLLSPRHPPSALGSLTTSLFKPSWTLFYCSAAASELLFAKKSSPYGTAIKDALLFNCQRTDSIQLSGFNHRNQCSDQKLTSDRFFIKTKLVEVNGIEPMASCVQGRRSPSWATPP